MAKKGGFTPLQHGAFPKSCPNCHKLYADERQFMAETVPPAHVRSDVRAVEDDDERDDVFLEVYRNCVCGSTLMELFHSRRDLSEEGLTRRQLFEDMLRVMEEAGIPRQEARAILLQQLDAFRK